LLTNFCSKCNNYEGLDAEALDIPFYCTKCGVLKFPYKALYGVVFLHQIKEPSKYEGSKLYIPENYRIHYKKGIGIILSVGCGNKDKKTGKIKQHTLCDGLLVGYDKDVPWSLPIIGTDGKLHNVIVCNVEDVYAEIEQ